jgi:hypothetical protein
MFSNFGYCYAADTTMIILIAREKVPVKYISTSTLNLVCDWGFKNDSNYVLWRQILSLYKVDDCNRLWQLVISDSWDDEVV